jgi:hypothetical protein
MRTIAELNQQIGIGKAGSIGKFWPEVQPLPMAVRSKFMKAQQAEDNGDMAGAAELLDMAIAAEK